MASQFFNGPWARELVAGLRSENYAPSKAAVLDLRARWQARKFVVSEITSNVPLDTWDYGIVVSYVRITAPSGTFVARIGLSDNGLQYTSYRQDSPC